MFRNCEFSKWPSYPLRVDGSMLAELTEAKLIQGLSREATAIAGPGAIRDIVITLQAPQKRLPRP